MSRLSFDRALARVVVAWEVWNRTHDRDADEARCCERSAFLYDALDELAAVAQVKAGHVVQALHELDARRARERPKPIPVRWQIREKDQAYRSPVHRVRPPVNATTICGEKVPSGAWAGNAVERPIRQKCPECWQEEDGGGS